MPQSDRQSVLAAIDGGMTAGQAAKHFAMSRSTILYWMSERKKGREPKAPVLTIAPPLPSPEPSPARAKEAKPGRVQPAYQTIAVANLTERARDGLRDTVDNTIAFLRPGPTGDGKAFANAANGLRHILTSIPDLMKIETTTATVAEVTASAPPTATDVAGEIAKRRRQQSTG